LLARTGQAPKWNFHKYLVDRNGNRVESFASKIEPDDSALVTALEKLLADREG
jgi:glutathione peroxidase